MFCPKCGREIPEKMNHCPFCDSNENQIYEENKKSKIRIVVLLNIISFILIWISSAIVIGVQDGSETLEDLFYAFKSDDLRVYLVLPVIVTVSFILSLTFAASKKNRKLQKIFAVFYVISDVVSIVVFAVESPFLLIVMICGFGFLLPVPIILQTIAAVNVMKVIK